ncbi:MAG: GDSL-type esterase/lipase family protein [Myxococcota bacterium]
MRGQWLLASLIGLATLFFALSIVRWLAPGLLGIPPDLRIVRVAEEKPAFYENIFRAEHEGVDGILLTDPIVGVRARPLLARTPDGLAGPTDLLGFRNAGVPNRADVIVIGDSQTYGNNATLEQSWPQRLAGSLGGGHRLYAMATGGWGAVQYWDAFHNALAFEPRVIVVAFYAGNDPMESFRLAYALDHWRELRPDPELDVDDAPREPPGDGWLGWNTSLPGGIDLRFTPGRRLYSLQDHPTTNAGWEIMAAVGERMAARAEEGGIALVLTLIPTKERVFAPLLAREGIAVPEPFAELVAAERRREAALAERLGALPAVTWVDVASPLEQAVARGQRTHRLDGDGHPVPAGYALIARAVAPAARAGLGDRSRAAP